MKCCWLLALVGCGRLGFGHDNRVDGGDRDAPGDGALVLRTAYVKASNTETFDELGYQIALSADGLTLAVSAPQEDSASPTDQADNSASNAGAVYVFVRSGATWVQQAYLKASNIDANDLFGSAVALSADGNTLAVGALGEASSTSGIDTTPDNAAPGAGAAYIFVRSGTTWTQQAYLKASNTGAGDHFGQSIALSATGDTLAIGADFEDSTATGIGGVQTSNQAVDSGAAYVFTRSGTAWTQDAYVKASNTESPDGFGFAVALSADGATLVVGASGEDSGSPTDQADNSQPEAGAAYVFVKAGTWSQQAYLKAATPITGDFFARRLSLSAAGDVLLVAGPGEDMVIANSGAAYVLERSGSTWSQSQYLKASNAGNNDQFGSDVAIAGNASALVVSAELEDSAAAGLDGDQLDDTCMDNGAAYAFEAANNAYTQQAYAKPPAPSIGDQFGYALAISSDGRTRAVAMPNEDSAATGVDGDARDESAADSGAVIVTYYY